MARKRPVTKGWTAHVQEALRSQGLSQRQLALDVGALPQALHAVLSGRIGSSGLVEPVSERLGIALPPLTTENTLLAQLRAEASELPDEDIELLLLQIRRLKKGTGAE